ncbi:cyanate hydratase [Thermocrinis albus DSM 14484]|uniref:Cyanate hydratase n=1 Tax=Thermocrinis albus (strain DSM 14484 / JCM 11386 / HI 11/12) TaxID=638303 RepID=D3SMH3_THEAH|nr:cyanate hydratase [Thermocrinis albus]ADC89953.1 cyanate hydratase [Thermocrinis albus DSM 14484]
MLFYGYTQAEAARGPALADVAHEKFGDGIMSAIDMKVDLQKVEEDGQERMLLTINGKWLRYRKF